MSMGSFETSEGNITPPQKKKKHPQTTCLTATISRGEAQMLMSVSSQWGLGAEAQATLSVPTVRTGLECPEDNLRGLM